MGKKYIYYLLGAIIASILLQFISIGILGNSIASNTPILGELLTVIDYFYLTHYLNHGLDMSNMENFLLRAVSLGATAYTAITLYDWGFYKLKELFKDSDELAPIIQLITIIVAIIIHFVIYYFLYTVYVETLFTLFHKLNTEMEKINKMFETFSY
ncbi:hypothetical protein BSK62_17045 [Paenibacillus odorifer]|jgi:hypothetical protein|uniref:hypothetical protein n=1 Tax=Paenibacillus TaxID=44249 RepID=UPI00096C67FA|nr:hypothetical protein [Paenibacillus odorifer]OMD64676.1 hypothetical protein BSK62_17045 [Paenibacillus odorifer]